MNVIKQLNITITYINKLIYDNYKYLYNIEWIKNNLQNIRFCYNKTF